MPTAACRLDWAEEGFSERKSPAGTESADSPEDRRSCYLLPAAEQCRIREMQKWIDLCA
jgi:hypothetical protein